MNYIQQMENSTLKADKVLLDFIRNRHAENLVNAQNMGKHYNRGDVLEMGITLIPVKRDGLHAQSQGDTVLNGVAYEIKYITKKTSASVALKGTTALFHLIAFNDGNRLIFKVIPTKDLKVSKGKLKFQDNIDLGQEFKGF